MKEIPSTRIHVVDALRGFAIISILLLHNLEHFDYYYSPSGLPEWMKVVDKHVWDTMFFLFSGKSYAIFAMLFGLTFFIQSNNQAKKGKDFRGRFAWRLVLLFGFGVINSVFYEGDILTFFALIGFTLIPVAHLSNKAVWWIAVFLMLQPVEWYNVLWGLQHPDVKLGDPLSWAYFGRAGAYIEGNSFIDTAIGNLTNGKAAVYLWNWEAGRFFQTASLFMLGMLAGRKGLFKSSEENNSFWTKALITSIIVIVPLFILKTNLSSWIPSESIRRPLELIFNSWYNAGFTIVLIGSFFLLFSKDKGRKILGVFIPLGKMSLSNYMMQSIAGSIIYCGFGLGLYKYTGSVYCLLIGIVLAVLQGIFCSWWLKSHKQGPLESIWHKLTWGKSK
jgi:uncharacterized protein